MKIEAYVRKVGAIGQPHREVFEMTPGGTDAEVIDEWFRVYGTEWELFTFVRTGLNSRVIVRSV